MEKKKRPPTPRELVFEAVLERLYFGRRPPEADMVMNGSILNRLVNGRGYSWEEMQKMVEGLALLRDRGALEPTVKRTDVVSLRWVYDSGQMINQVTRCLDAYYSEVAKPTPKRGGAAALIQDLLSTSPGSSSRRSGS